MTLLFCDSFDHYADADEGYKWSGSSNGFGQNLWINSSAGRFGTNGLQVNGIYGRHIYKDLAASHATLVVGVAFRVDGFQDGGVIMALLDGATAQVELRMTSTGLLYVARNGTSVATSTLTISTNVTNYIEWKVTINNTTGSTEVRVNGVTYITASSLDTQNSGNATVSRLQLAQNIGNFANNGYYDDLYVLNTSGSAPANDFLGDVRVQCIKPSGNGNSSVLAGSDGNSTDNYLLVDDPSDIDDDSTYVESGTVGDKDTYAHGNLTPTAGTVVGVQLMLTAKKTDAGARSIVSVARLSSTEVDSAAYSLATSYTASIDIRETKPGGGAWTITDVNNAEFGVKVNA